MREGEGEKMEREEEEEERAAKARELKTSKVGHVRACSRPEVLSACLPPVGRQARDTWVRLQGGRGREEEEEEKATLQACVIVRVRAWARGCCFPTAYRHTNTNTNTHVCRGLGAAVFQRLATCIVASSRS